MKRFLVFIGVLLLPTASGWAQGLVYRGQIDHQTIVACLPNDSTSGRFYYLQSGIDIRLEAEHLPDASGLASVWTEYSDGVHPSGIWHLMVSHGDTLHGSWQANAQAHPQPMLLHAIADSCEGDNSPYRQLRAQGQILRLGSIQSWEHVRFREVLALQGNIRGIQMTSGLPVSEMNAINAVFDHDIHEQIIAALQCASVAAGANHDYTYAATLHFFNLDWISVDVHEAHVCGNAGAGDAHYGLTWNAHTAAPQNLAMWFNPGVWQGAPVLQLPPDSPLGLRVRQHRLTTPVECEAPLAGNGYYNLELGADGMVFLPSLAEAPPSCAQSSIVPYAELQPFLLPSYQKNLGASL